MFSVMVYFWAKTGASQMIVNKISDNIIRKIVQILLSWNLPNKQFCYTIFPQFPLPHLQRSEPQP